MIGFCPLASGSKGNCIYFGSEHAKILIDAGISGKMTKERLAAIGVSIDEISAILVTHEHGDHIRGLKVLSERYQLPILANADTAKRIIETFPTLKNFKIFTTGYDFEYKDLKIHPFRVQHDTIDPVMFTIETMEHKVGICTDLGFVSSLIKVKLRDCDYLYIESNHQPSMVHACSRPASYKQRVLGRSGHLSNEECGELIKEVIHDGLKHIHLAHLSEECNHPDLALQIAEKAVRDAGFSTPVSIAPQKTSGQKVSFLKTVQK
jgi:phosphoribosyl 1,2-cyclic phosphodiesterase